MNIGVTSQALSRKKIHTKKSLRSINSGKQKKSQGLIWNNWKLKFYEVQTYRDSWYQISVERHVGLLNSHMASREEMLPLFH